MGDLVGIDIHTVNFKIEFLKYLVFRIQISRVLHRVSTSDQLQCVSYCVFNKPVSILVVLNLVKARVSSKFHFAVSNYITMIL